MIKLRTSGGELYIDPEKIEAMEQKEERTHIVTGRWNYNVAETPQEIYEKIEEANKSKNKKENA